MQDETPNTHQTELAEAKPAAVMSWPDGYEIREALYEVVHKIGDGPILAQPDSTNWWEALSHGLAAPVLEGSPAPRNEDEKSFLERCKNADAYLKLESDFLRFGDNGNSGQREKTILIGTDFRLKALALRIIAFLQTRAVLETKGFALPENPDLGIAIDAVRMELARDVTARNQFARLAQEGGIQLELHQMSERKLITDKDPFAL